MATTMRFGYFAYRAWAFDLLSRVTLRVGKDTVVLVATTPQCEIDACTRPVGTVVFDPTNKGALSALIKEYRIDVAFFYGWSWMVPKELTDIMDCLCLHPSLLPRYRGGTPFQHQIMNNEQNGGLTIFRMNEGIDAGDILEQRPFSLQGTLKDILDRVVEHGADATVKVFNEYQRGTVQYHLQTDLEKFPPNKRRKPQDSEIQFVDLEKMTQNDFYNFVRALDDPYQNCFITLDDESKLFVQQVERIKGNEAVGIIFDGTSSSLAKGGPSYIKMNDGYVRILRFCIK